MESITYLGVQIVDNNNVSLALFPPVNDPINKRLLLFKVRTQ